MCNTTQPSQVKYIKKCEWHVDTQKERTREKWSGQMEPDCEHDQLDQCMEDGREEFGFMKS